MDKEVVGLIDNEEFSAEKILERIYETQEASHYPNHYGNKLGAVAGEQANDLVCLGYANRGYGQ